MTIPRTRTRAGIALATIGLLATGCASAGTSTTSAAPPSSTTSTTTSTPSPTAPPNGLRVTPGTAPTGFAVPAATWLDITRPDGTTQVAAVFRPPAGRGRHPVVVALHGSSGLPLAQLAWARKLAAAGFVVLVGCYLDAYSPGALFMPCPGLPRSDTASDDAMRASYTALLDVAAGLPGVPPGALGTFGLSQGAIVALSDDDPRVAAIAADSGYRKPGGTSSAPVLLLGMTDDPNVEHARVVGFERAERAAGRPVDARYYPGTGHVTIFGPPPVSDDATNLVATFLHEHLG